MNFTTKSAKNTKRGGFLMAGTGVLRSQISFFVAFVFFVVR